LQATDLSVVGTASDGRAALQKVQELKPDLVVLDITMPGLNGMDATRQILAQFPLVKVLVLSMHPDGPFVTETLNAGASGYILKDAASDELVRAIQAVMNGQIYLSSEITGTVLRNLAAQHPQANVASGPALSARSREVLQLLAEGKSVKEIAAQLGVSVKTVENHRNQIMTTLGIRSIAELTKYAVRTGLTPL
jgi:DNA-binding NarL/FixJ family response regulator